MFQFISINKISSFHRCSVLDLADETIDQTLE